MYVVCVCVYFFPTFFWIMSLILEWVLHKLKGKMGQTKVGVFPARKGEVGDEEDEEGDIGMGLHKDFPSAHHHSSGHCENV